MTIAVILVAGLLLTRGVLRTCEFSLANSPTPSAALPGLKFFDLLTLLAAAGAFFYFFAVIHDPVKMLALAGLAVLGELAVRAGAFYLAVKRACSVNRHWRHCGHGDSSLECIACIRGKQCNIAGRILKYTRMPLTTRPRLFRRRRRAASRRTASVSH